LLYATLLRRSWSAEDAPFVSAAKENRNWASETTEIRLMYGQEDDVQATQIEGSRLLEQAVGVRD